MTNLDLRSKLTDRLPMDRIYEICYLTQGDGNDHLKEILYSLTFDADTRVATNALWAFTHFDLFNNQWLYTKHNDLIDRIMTEKNTTKLRLMLNLLMRQPFEADTLRADFIDFCLGKITAFAQPYAVRALCMKLAYEQMRFYPELLDELVRTLQALTHEPLSPGLLSAHRQILKKISSSHKFHQLTHSPSIPHSQYHIIQCKNLPFH